MSIAKVVISGIVYRTPEKRFTGNNIPVTSFALNIDEKEISLVRVIARGNNAETLEQSVSKGDRIVVEGRLQMSTVQAEDGSEKKITEIDLSSFEVISSSVSAANTNSTAKSSEKKVVEFSDMEMTDTLIGEEEIPF